MISVVESSWKSVHKIVCQGSTLETIHFNNPVNGMDGGAGWTHSRFAGNTELEECLLPQMGVLALRGTLTICGKGSTEIRNSLHMSMINPSRGWVASSGKLCLE